MATAAMAVQAETLYFTPDGSSSATNKFGKFMFSSDHWTTAAGVRQAPNHGDILVFEKSSQLTANGASGHTAAHVNGMWFKGVMPPISQGEMHMNAGSMGVTNSGTNASCSWYVGMRFYGTGEVPLYLGGSSQITCQRCFYQTDGGTTTLVKLGSGTLAFSDGSNWSETTRGSWAKTRLEGGTIYWSETGSGGKAWDLQVFPIGHELTFADTGAGATFSCGAHDCEFKDIPLREASPLLSPSHTLTDAGSTIRYFRFIGTPGLNPMGFGGKVDDAVNLLVLHQLVEGVKVADVHLDELIVRLVLYVLEIGQVAGVSEFVEVDDVVFGVFVDKEAHHVRSDESRASCYQNVPFHVFNVHHISFISTGRWSLYPFSKLLP